MAFELQPHPPDVAEQVGALPAIARSDLEGAVAFLLDAPFDCPPYLRSRPEGLRRRAFGLGLGLVVFQVRFDDAVQIELVQWLA